MSQARFAYLDTIRGLAAFLVVIEHTLMTLIDKVHISSDFFLTKAIQYLEVGRFGVMLFFITSGFVIPWSLNPKYKRPILRFALTRFFRLYPLYWVSIILALIFGSYGLTLESSQQVMANLTMAQKYLGEESVINVYWTLQIELAFCVLCAFLFAIAYLRKQNTYFYTAVGWLFISLIVAILRFYSKIEIPITFPLALFAMFTGALCRQVVIDKSMQAREALKTLIIVTLLVFPILFYFYYGAAAIRYLTANSAALLTFAFLISRGRINNPYTAYLGVISYSVYLMHPIVLNAYLQVVGNEQLQSLPILYSVLFVCIVSALVSHFTYKWIESPAINLGSLLQKKYNLSAIRVASS